MTFGPAIACRGRRPASGAAHRLFQYWYGRRDTISFLSWSMFPPPLYRMSTMIPFRFHSSSISLRNRAREGWFMARMCTYPIWPFVSRSTSSRFFATHSSYIRSVMDVTLRIRTLRAPSPRSFFATRTGTYSFIACFRLPRSFSPPRAPPLASLVLPDPDRHVLVHRLVQDPPVVVPDADLLPVDGEHVVPDGEIQPFLVRRAVPVDVGDPVALAGRLQLEAQVPRPVRPVRLHARRPAHAHVGRVQLAEHVVRQVVHVLVRAHVAEEQIGRASC